MSAGASLLLSALLSGWLTQTSWASPIDTFRVCHQGYQKDNVEMVFFFLIIIIFFFFGGGGGGGRMIYVAQGTTLPFHSLVT